MNNCCGATPWPWKWMSCTMVTFPWTNDHYNNDLDCQGHALEIDNFNYHHWISWPCKHIHNNYTHKNSVEKSQIQGGCNNLQDCVIAVSKWFPSNRLQLNARKTELLWFETVTKLRKLDPALRCLTVAPMSFNQSTSSGISRSTLILISRWKHTSCHAGPASSIFVDYDIRRSFGRDVTKILHHKINILIKRAANPITGNSKLSRDIQKWPTMGVWSFHCEINNKFSFLITLIKLVH